MFPKEINLTSAGNAYDSQNKATGTFYGHLKSMRAIKSANNPTCFAVIDIEADNERKPFQVYLNYNKDKAQQSMDFLVRRIKDLAIACGKEVKLDEVRDRDWLETTTKKLVDEKAGLWFKQSETKRGLEIEFLDKEPATKTEW